MTPVSPCYTVNRFLPEIICTVSLAVDKLAPWCLDLGNHSQRQSCLSLAVSRPQRLVHLSSAHVRVDDSCLDASVLTLRLKITCFCLSLLDYVAMMGMTVCGGLCVLQVCVGLSPGYSWTMWTSCSPTGVTSMRLWRVRHHTHPLSSAPLCLTLFWLCCRDRACDDLRDRAGFGHVLGDVPLERGGDHGRTCRTCFSVSYSWPSLIWGVFGVRRRTPSPASST